jgi:hypothetical protein
MTGAIDAAFTAAITSSLRGGARGIAERQLLLAHGRARDAAAAGGLDSVETEVRRDGEATPPTNAFIQQAIAI